MAIIDATDTNLIDYIDNKLDELDIPYSKYWKSKYNDYQCDYEPIILDGFIVIYGFDSLKAMRYKDKIAQDFIDNREHLERCLCLK